ncbi:hypothetical protein AB2L27_18000 [Kineococcus sp. LSe6-4]|uniref:Uncharacterized protein n=1 Tax=Kineococcus halophytocola TaxID=3234027 RepID=A0ABV4H6D3_9ACTN
MVVVEVELDAAVVAGEEAGGGVPGTTAFSVESTAQLANRLVEVAADVAEPLPGSIGSEHPQFASTGAGGLPVDDLDLDPVRWHLLQEGAGDALVQFVHFCGVHCVKTLSLCQ